MPTRTPRPFRLIVVLGVFTLGLLSAGCDDDSDSQENGLPVLKKHLTVDLNSLDSLAVLEDNDPHKETVVTGLAGIDAEGNIVGLELLETTTGESYPYQPWPYFICPTTEWILMSLGDFMVNIRQEDDSFTEVQCNTLAARRDDGALFCTPLGIRGYNGDNMLSERTVFSNGNGDIIYVVSGNVLDQNILYRLDMAGPDGPTATHMADIINVQGFSVNSTGDLLVHFRPSAYDPGSAKLRVYPVDGAAPLELNVPEIPGWTAFQGIRGTPTEDNFYILEGDDFAEGFTGVIHQISKVGMDFVVTDFPILIQGANQCYWAQNLSGRIHAICGLNTAVIMEDGAVIAEPALTPVTELDRTFSVVGAPYRFASSRMMIFGGLGESQRFVRLDGTVQHVALLDPDINVLHMSIAESGAIDFTGMLNSTSERIMGTVPADSTAVVILQIEGLNISESPNFTRIN